MGDLTDALPPVSQESDSAGWLELAWLHEELEDAKKVIMALQNLATSNTAALEPEPEVPKWKEHAAKKGPKRVKPDAFSGKMDETESFVNACTMYILGQVNNFPDETMAIMWVLSYMKEGLAREWRNEYLETVENGKPRQKMLEDFFTMIKEEFGDPDKRATKIYKLHTITQGERMVDEHVLAFRKAAWSSGYGEALIEEFKRSLNSRLHECVSNLDNIPDTIDRWYKQAMCLDRQWRRVKQEVDYYNRMTNNV